MHLSYKTKLAQKDSFINIFDKGIIKASSKFC